VNTFSTFITEDRVVHRGSVHFTEETLEQRVSLLSDHALVSNLYAHETVDTVVSDELITKWLGDGLRADESAHPNGGVGPEPAEIFNLGRSVFEPLGQKPAPHEHQPDLIEARSALLQLETPNLDVRLGEPSHDSLAGVFMVGRHNVFFELRLGVKHRTLGFGCATVLQMLPPRPDAQLERTKAAQAVRDGEPGDEWDEAITACGLLNEAEWTTREPMLSLGTWMPKLFIVDEFLLTHWTFHPNASLYPGLGRDLVLDMASRSVWATMSLGD
jgi:hypothetical protein